MRILPGGVFFPLPDLRFEVLGATGGDAEFSSEGSCETLGILISTASEQKTYSLPRS